MHMKFSRRKTILFLTSLFIFLMITAWGMIRTVRAGADGNGSPFSLRYRQEDARQQIKGFYSEEILYFCIPSYMQLEDIKVELSGTQKLTVEAGNPERQENGGAESGNAGNIAPEAVPGKGESEEKKQNKGNKESVTLKNGDHLEGFALDTIYQMCLETEGGEEERFAAMFLQGSEIPAVWLTTASGSMEYILAQKGNFESGYMQVVNADGRTDCMGKADSISGRGNTAWDAEKKSFTIKLGGAENVLGMGAEKTWVLNANYYDGAYVRNQTGFEMAQAGGIAFVPGAQFVELYINGEYMGLYQLMEKLKVSKNRVDIGNSYLLEIDYSERAEAEEDYIVLSNEQPIVIHAPVKSRDVEGVREFFEGFGRRMEERDVPVEHIDLSSFVKMFVMEDILQDMDFGYTSHFMYLDLHKKVLYDGPVWDLDNTMGRGKIREAEPFFGTDYDLPYNNLSRWYSRLCGLEDFRRLAETEYWENFRPALERMAQGGVREQIQEIRSSIAMDARRFTGERSIFMGDASLEEHVAYLEDYLKSKLAVMDACYQEDGWAIVQGAELPLPEKQESAFAEEGETESGMTGYLMRLRFPVILLVMCISGVILWYQCRRGIRRI